MPAPKPGILLLLLSCVLLISTIAHSQIECTPVFTGEYRSTGNIEPLAMKTLPDGTYIVAGRGTLSNSPNYDGLVMHLDATGNIMWSFLIGGDSYDEFTGVSLLDNGNFVLFGSSASFGHPEQKGWLVQIGPAGGVIWSRVIGATTLGTDRVKAVTQFTDGDLVGTYNENDSTALSNPVVFKIGLDGTPRWTHKFDNGGEDSFTSIAFEGNNIYACGFYSATASMGVMVKLNSASGNLIDSRTIYWRGMFREELVNLEIRNNQISYGIWAHEMNPSSFPANALVLVRTDFAGRTIFSLEVEDGGDIGKLTPYRTNDTGFMVLRSHALYSGEIPSVVKVDRYGLIGWGNNMAMNFNHQYNYALDITSDGGCISAGYFNNYSTGTLNQMAIFRMNKNGESGNCTYSPATRFTDTTGYHQQPLSWNIEEPLSEILYDLVNSNNSIPGISVQNMCSTSLCTDKTPLPPGCNKTFRLEYSGKQETIFRDIITTPDGGKIAIGDIRYHALAVKIGANGDVVWSKNYEEFFHNLKFMRILRTADNNYIIFANNYLTLNHGASREVAMVKIDENGNVIWSKDMSRPFYSYEAELGDVCSTPDNGFVMVINDGWGGGGIYTYVIRYDANANVIWQKDVTHPASVPVYRSITCSKDAVFLGYDSYDYSNYDKFGIERLNLGTGTLEWAKRFTVGTTNFERINRIFSINDTVYAFVNNFIPSTPSGSDQNLVMAKIDPHGNLFQSMILNGGVMNSVQTYYHMDQSPPTVTMTPDEEFVTCNRINGPSANVVNISRFNKEGQAIWSRNMLGMNKHSPFNIHPQGTGFIIVGTVDAPRPGNSQFTNSFVLKVDSAGHIMNNAAGDCQQVDYSFTNAPGSVTDAWLTEKYAFDLTQVINRPGLVVSQDEPVDATAFCQLKGNCGVVNMRQKGTGCSLKDTLVYYLENPALCEAAATWKFDSAYLRKISANGDSIQLVPVQEGNSIVTAEIEGSCFFKIQTMTATVLRSARNMTLGSDTTICAGMSIRLNAGSGYQSYLWNDSSIDSTLTINSPGQYFVMVQDNCGTSSADTIMVNAANISFNLFGDSVKCNSESVLLRASGGYNNYQWTSNYNIISQVDSAKVNPLADTKYIVSAEKWPGCVVRDSILVTVLKSPAIQLPVDASLCAGDSLLINVPVSFQRYLWNTGDTTGSLVVRQPGKYSLVATFSNGCQSLDTFQLLSLHSLPVPALDKNPALCFGSTRVLNSSQNFSSYLWNDGSTGSSLTVRDTGSYWLTVTDSYGCRGTDVVRIDRIADLPKNFLGEDTSVCQYGKLIVATRGHYKSYTWNDFSSGSTTTITKAGVYWLKVTDENNCVGVDTINVASKQCMVGLYIPNAFTPNADGLNDSFKPVVFGNLTTFEFLIFDRWGNKVFESNSISRGWTGLINGRETPSGVYVWYCKYALDGQPVRMEKGTVTLIR